MPTFEVHLPQDAFDMLEKAASERGASKDELLVEAICSQFGERSKRFPSCASREQMMEMLDAGLKSGPAVEVNNEYWDRLDQRIEGR